MALNDKSDTTVKITVDQTALRKDLQAAQAEIDKFSNQAARSLGRLGAGIDQKRIKQDIAAIQVELDRFYRRNVNVQSKLMVQVDQASLLAAKAEIERFQRSLPRQTATAAPAQAAAAESGSSNGGGGSTAKSVLKGLSIPTNLADGISAAVDAVVALGSAALATATRFEKLEGGLRGVTGSAANAKEAFATLQQFAVETPFGLEDVTKAFTSLKANGLDPSQAALRDYGNTAAAWGRDLTDVVNATVEAAKGHFNGLEAFGIAAQQQGDKVSFTFQGVTTTVSNNAGAIEGYLRDLGKTQFAGALNEQSQTLGSSVDNLSERWDIFLGNLGKTSAFKDAVGWLNQLLDATNHAIAPTAEERLKSLRAQLEELDNHPYSPTVDFGSEGYNPSVDEQEIARLATRRELLEQIARAEEEIRKAKEAHSKNEGKTPSGPDAEQQRIKQLQEQLKALKEGGKAAYEAVLTQQAAAAGGSMALQAQIDAVLKQSGAQSEQQQRQLDDAKQRAQAAQAGLKASVKEGEEALKPYTEALERLKKAAEEPAAAETPYSRYASALKQLNSDLTTVTKDGLNTDAWEAYAKGLANLNAKFKEELANYKSPADIATEQLRQAAGAEEDPHKVYADTVSKLNEQLKKATADDVLNGKAWEYFKEALAKADKELKKHLKNQNAAGDAAADSLAMLGNLIAKGDWGAAVAGLGDTYNALQKLWDGSQSASEAFDKLKDGILNSASAGQALGDLVGGLLGRSDQQNKNARIGATVASTVGSFFGVPKGLSSFVGNIVGGLFGPGKSDSTASVEIWNSTGTFKNTDVKKKKQSAENMSARDQLASSILKYSELLRTATGGTVVDKVYVRVGSRDGNSWSTGFEQGHTAVGDIQGTLSQVLAAVTRTLTGVPDELKMHLQSIDFSDLTRAESDVNFVLGYQDAIGKLNGTLEGGSDAVAAARKEVVDQLNYVRDFADTAKRLGYDVGSMTEALRGYVERFAGIREAAPALTEVETKVAALNASFEQLAPLLEQVGYSSADAAATIVTARESQLAHLREDVSNNQDRRFNELVGNSFINSIRDLMTTHDADRRDAAAVGLTTAGADRNFTAALNGVLTPDLRTDQLQEALRLFGDVPEVVQAANAALAQLNSTTSETAQVVRSAVDIANERKGLEQQLLQLQGNTAELRRRELATLDPSNRALQEQIWGLQDLARSQQIIADLNERQAVLNDRGRPDASIRALERRQNAEFAAAAAAGNTTAQLQQLTSVLAGEMTAAVADLNEATTRRSEDLNRRLYTARAADPALTSAGREAAERQSTLIERTRELADAQSDAERTILMTIHATEDEVRAHEALAAAAERNRQIVDDLNERQAVLNDRGRPDASIRALERRQNAEFAAATAAGNTTAQLQQLARVLAGEMTAAVEDLNEETTRRSEDLRKRLLGAQASDPLLSPQAKEALELQATAIDRQRELNDANSDAERATLHAIYAAEDQARANQQLADSAEKARQAMEALTAQGGAIRKWVDQVRAGSIETYLSPQQRLDNARSDYQRQLSAAQQNDSDALGSITEYAQRYIDALVTNEASGTDSSNVISQVLGQLEDLPAVKSWDQQVLEALQGLRDGISVSIDLEVIRIITEVLSALSTEDRNRLIQAQDVVRDIEEHLLRPLTPAELDALVEGGMIGRNVEQWLGRDLTPQERSALVEADLVERTIEQMLGRQLTADEASLLLQPGTVQRLIMQIIQTPTGNPLLTDASVTRIINQLVMVDGHLVTEEALSRNIAISLGNVAFEGQSVANRYLAAIAWNTARVIGREGGGLFITDDPSTAGNDTSRDGGSAAQLSINTAALVAAIQTSAPTMVAIPPATQFYMGGFDPARDTRYLLANSDVARAFMQGTFANGYAHYDRYGRNEGRAYARGTDFHPGGWALVGEEGPELAFLPRGTGVATAAETRAFLSRPAPRFAAPPAAGIPANGNQVDSRLLTVMGQQNGLVAEQNRLLLEQNRLLRTAGQSLDDIAGSNDKMASDRGRYPVGRRAAAQGG